jgi:hypothetical protein
MILFGVVRVRLLRLYRQKLMMPIAVIWSWSYAEKPSLDAWQTSRMGGMAYQEKLAKEVIDLNIHYFSRKPWNWVFWLQNKPLAAIHSSSFMPCSSVSEDNRSLRTKNGSPCRWSVETTHIIIRNPWVAARQEFLGLCSWLMRTRYVHVGPVVTTYAIQENKYLNPWETIKIKMK